MIEISVQSYWVGLCFESKRPGFSSIIVHIFNRTFFLHKKQFVLTFSEQNGTNHQLKFWCHPWRSNLSPSTCEAEAITMSCLNDNSLMFTVVLYFVLDIVYYTKWSPLNVSLTCLIHKNNVFCQSRFKI